MQNCGHHIWPLTPVTGEEKKMPNRDDFMQGSGMDMTEDLMQLLSPKTNLGYVIRTAHVLFYHVYAICNIGK